ncbi:hypothetical protein [uncultured Fibrobacter sp.]|uniref:hypothetical protein n=1 Tax=uncultured Fibrobacter sp. TaxID=261512 RepID=UPI002601D9C5|nr:hypothetical protein [uncultured Fibrobacter sp.]
MQRLHYRGKFRIGDILKEICSKNRPGNARIIRHFLRCNGNDRIRNPPKQAHELACRLEQRRFIVDKSPDRNHGPKD